MDIGRSRSHRRRSRSHRRRSKSRSGSRTRARRSLSRDVTKTRSGGGAASGFTSAVPLKVMPAADSLQLPPPAQFAAGDVPTPKLSTPIDIWPTPFFIEGPVRRLRWTSPLDRSTYEFAATLLEPEGGQFDRCAGGASAASTSTGFPLMVYLAGCGSVGGLTEMNLGLLRKSIHVPTVVVAPYHNNTHPWWFLRGGGTGHGWVDGVLVPERVRGMKMMIEALVADSAIDAKWLSLTGFSAGAYAVTELLAAGLAVRSIIIGGVHGHGQITTENLDGKRICERMPEYKVKWDSYIERLRKHSGCSGGMIGVHCRRDKPCPFNQAELIYEVLSARNGELGMPAVYVDEIEISKKKSKEGHGYDIRVYDRAEIVAHMLPKAVRRTYVAPEGAPARQPGGAAAVLRAAQASSAKVSPAGLHVGAAAGLSSAGCLPTAPLMKPALPMQSGAIPALPMQAGAIGGVPMQAGSVTGGGYDRLRQILEASVSEGDPGTGVPQGLQCAPLGSNNDNSAPQGGTGMPQGMNCAPLGQPMAVASVAASSTRQWQRNSWSRW